MCIFPLRIIFLLFKKKKKIPSDIPLRRPVRNIHSFQSRGRLSSALAQERDFAVDSFGLSASRRRRGSATVPAATAPAVCGYTAAFPEPLQV